MKDNTKGYVMKLSVCIALLFMQGWQTAAPAAQESSSFFRRTEDFINLHVQNGLINYQAIKRSPGALRSLLESIAGFDVGAVSEETEKAFLINSYNLLVIQSVIAEYPISSPMDIDGFFDVTRHRIANELLTLNDIENIKLREKFADARLHFALVCGAQSCPPLVEAFFPDKLDRQLETRTRAALNDPGFIRIEVGRKKILISEIFRWYKEDFERSSGNVRDFINAFRAQPLPPDYGIDYYKYDWSLNKRDERKTGHLLLEGGNLQATYR
jgi:hypothetical protein